LRLSRHDDHNLHPDHIRDPVAMAGGDGVTFLVGSVLVSTAVCAGIGALIPVRRWQTIRLEPQDESR
jgi:hypothetical protein